MEHKTFVCQYCKKTSSKPNLMSLRQHEIRCNKNPNKNNNMQIPSRSGKYSHNDEASEITKKRRISLIKKNEYIKTQNFECIHCKKDCKLTTFKSSFLSIVIHESQCIKNPSKISNRKVTKETKRRLSEASKLQTWTQSRRDKLSKAMIKAAAKYPESYSSGNRGCRVKLIEVDGIKLRGTWEVIFYNWAKNNNLNPQKCLKSFPYEWDKPRQYFPDFYLPSLDVYVEVKGYETDRDIAKWKHFPEKLIILRKEEIEQIKKGTFRMINLRVPFSRTSRT